MGSVLSLFNKKYFSFLLYFKEAEAEIHGYLNGFIQETRTPHLRKELGPLPED